MKVIAKTETFSEFLARGGKVTKCPPGATEKKKYTRKPREEKKEQEVDYSALPMSLKITLGIK